MKADNTYNKNGFKIPKDYFESFEDKIFDKISDESIDIQLSKNSNSGFKIPNNYFETIEDEIYRKSTHNISLKEQHIKHGYTTPKEYFKNLESSIIDTTIDANNSKVLSLVSRKRILYFSGIAAMIAIIISLSIPKNDNSLKNIDTIDISYIQEYLTEEDIELEDTDIAVLFGDDQELIHTLNSDTLNDDTLIDYLSDEELESDLIYID